MIKALVAEGNLAEAFDIFVPLPGVIA